MIDQNMQQKATVKDAENAKTTAQADVTKATGTATDSMQKYLAAHPGPAGAGNAPSAAPAYSGANIPIVGAPPGTGANPASALNTMVGGAPGVPAAGKSLPPAVLDALRKAMSGSA